MVRVSTDGDAMTYTPPPLLLATDDVDDPGVVHLGYDTVRAVCGVRPADGWWAVRARPNGTWSAVPVCGNCQRVVAARKREAR